MPQALSRIPRFKPAFWATPRPGFSDRPFGGFGHLHDLKVFYTDQVESAGQVGRGLFDPVLAPILFAGLHLGDQGPQLGAPGRPAPRTRQAALQPQQSFSFTGPESWDFQELTGGQCRRRHNSPVDSDNGTPSGRGDGDWGDGEREMPAPRTVASDPIRLRVGQCLGQPEPNPADLRNENPTPLPGQPLDAVGLGADNPEALVSSGLAPSRPTVRSRIEAGYGPIEVPQRLLLHRLRPSPQPAALGTRLSQLPTLFSKPRWVAAATKRPHPPLLSRQVPHIPRVPALLEQQSFLLRGRCEAVPGHERKAAMSDRQFRDRCSAALLPPVHCQGLGFLRRSA